MKRAWLIVGMIAAVFMFTSAAMADDPTINLASFDPRYLNGGPFIATVGGDYGDLDADRLVPGQFITFCLEKGEFFQLGYNYYFTIDTFADGGGGKDELDPMSAYLYYQFRTGESIGFAGPADTPFEWQALQAAFWHIEHELFLLPTPSLGTVEALAKTYVDAAAVAAWATIGPVVVLNLYRDNNNNGSFDFDDGDWKRQSQIALLKPQGVPEPATMLLLGLGLVGLAAVGRKLKR